MSALMSALISASVSAFQGEPLAGKIRRYHSQMRHNMSDRKATYRSRLELLGESAEGSKAHHSALKTLERVPLFRGDADVAAGRHVYSARLLAPYRDRSFAGERTAHTGTWASQFHWLALGSYSCRSLLTARIEPPAASEPQRSCRLLCRAGVRGQIQG